MFKHLLLLSFSVAVLAANGIDVSGSDKGQSFWSCIAGGNSFAIAEGWQGGYQWNGDVVANIAEARAGGLAYVDTYGFFCPNCDGNSDPAAAMANFVNKLASNSVNYGMVWIDVEQCDGCWSGDMGANCNYVSGLMSQAQSMGVHVGAYSSEGEWPMTVGSGCTSLDSLPLWYAHYDGDASFNDGAYNFGGWGSPAMKQYAGDTTSCGGDVDLNWYPDGLRAKWLEQTQQNIDRMRGVKVPSRMYNTTQTFKPKVLPRLGKTRRMLDVVGL